MELECSSNKQSNSGINVKASFVLIQLRTYKNDHEQIKKRFLKLQDNYIIKKSQEALITDEINEIEDIGGKKNNQKSKLIENEALAYKQQQSLEQAKRNALEIEHASIGIMNGLYNNNEMLKVVNNKVHNLNDNLDDSNSIITRIMKKENRNKLIIAVFSIIILIIFGVILYNYLNTDEK